jgi:general secretion pathway protein C
MPALEHRLSPTLFRPDFYLRLAVEVVNVILVIALARALAGLTLALLFGPSPAVVGMAAPPPGPLADRANANFQPATDYAAIGAWHLFGRVEAGQSVEAPPPVSLPVTPLNLRLVGVFFVEQGDRALALIAEGNNLERGYRPGEPLPGGALLERIQRDHVIVSRNGRSEVLNLPKSSEVIQSSTPPLEPAPPVGIESPAEPASSRESPAIDASAVADRLRGEATVRPQALEDIAFVSPYVQNGQFVGFRLRPGRDAQLLRQLGLNSGDVITEINGSRLNSPVQGLAMLQAVLNADQVEVRVLRNGAEIPLTFSLAGSPR